mgnify:CR=1 FL=1
MTNAHSKHVPPPLEYTPLGLTLQRCAGQGIISVLHAHDNYTDSDIANFDALFSVPFSTTSWY